MTAVRVWTLYRYHTKRNYESKSLMKINGFLSIVFGQCYTLVHKGSRFKSQRELCVLNLFYKVHPRFMFSVKNLHLRRIKKIIKTKSRGYQKCTAVNINKILYELSLLLEQFSTRITRASAKYSTVLSLTLNTYFLQQCSNFSQLSKNYRVCQNLQIIHNRIEFWGSWQLF